MSLSNSPRQVIAGITVSLGLSVLAVQVAAEDAPFPIDDDGFKIVRIAPGVSSGKTILTVLAPHMDHFPHSEEGQPHMSLRMERTESGISFELVETGFADDSVEGDHYRGAIIKTDGGWELIELGYRPICVRGEPSAKGRCP